MMESRPYAGTSKRKLWLYPLAALGGASAACILAVRVADTWTEASQGAGFWDLFRAISAADATQVLSGTGEVIAAILGIVITVASIIVQLAANRYTPRVTEMFFRDRTNLAVMGFFVVSAVFSLWVNFSIRTDPSGSSVPRWGVLVTMGLLTMSLLLMAPYFAYVFDFLEPYKIVGRIKSLGQRQAVRHEGGEKAASIGARQLLALSSLEQLADIAQSAIEQRDKGIASGTMDALSDLVVAYIPEKKRLDPRWFRVEGSLLRDPDFVSMNPDALERMVNARTWLEYKALRQLLMIYREALTAMPDIVTRIAIDTRYIGQTAIASGDKAALDIVVKFFNTYMRRALNAKDVAAAYNNLNQYRYLVEELLKAGWDAEAVLIAGHFKYYAQTAYAMKLPFLTETVAFDLCTACEVAYDLKAPSSESLLRIFLEVDKEAEDAKQESALRGVRKAQIKLATFYLQKGEEGLARLIWHDMRDERPDRLRSIRTELLSVTSDEFWEINDRGGVFEYIEPERRKLLESFFDWFPVESTGAPRSVASSAGSAPEVARAQSAESA